MTDKPETSGSEEDAASKQSTAKAAQEEKAPLPELEMQRAFYTAQERTNEIWQKSILPFVQWGMVSLAVIVFVVVSFAGFSILKSSLNGSVERQPYSDVYISSISRNDSGQFDVQRAQFALAGYQSIRRHDQAHMSALTRELLRFASFIMGCALTFIGALFVVGKFTDPTPTTVTAKGLKVEGGLTTASPGIFAMALGCFVIIFALAWRQDVTVNDPAITVSSPQYSAASQDQQPAPNYAPPPQSLLDEACQKYPDICEDVEQKK